MYFDFFSHLNFKVKECLYIIKWLHVPNVIVTLSIRSLVIGRKKVRNVCILRGKDVRASTWECLHIGCTALGFRNVVIACEAHTSPLFKYAQNKHGYHFLPVQSGSWPALKTIFSVLLNVLCNVQLTQSFIRGSESPKIQCTKCQLHWTQVQFGRADMPTQPEHLSMSSFQQTYPSLNHFACSWHMLQIVNSQENTTIFTSC